MSFPGVGLAKSLSLLFFLFLLWDRSCVRVCEAHVAEKLSSSRLVVSLDRLIPAAKTCLSTKGSSSKGRSSLTISHRDGPCSALRTSSTTPTIQWKEYNHQVLLEDEKRVLALQMKKTGASATAEDFTTLLQSAAAIPVRRGLSLGTGNYVVTVGIGTPKKDHTVVFDTGSSVGWIQCQPCAVSCHPQQEPIFDPVASSSYANVSCGDTACEQLHVKGCDNKSCLYGVRYGDGSVTVGFLGKDNLALTTASGADEFPGFIFGCGQNNKGLFGKTSGLLGLSRNPLSLVSQTAGKYGSVFSYCLPATMSSTGHLNFGPPESSSGGISYTPMLSNPTQPDIYFVRMTGITVGGQQLPVSASDLSARGTIIDSGTVITRLPQTAYAALRSAFRNAMSNYTLGMPIPPLLDTCYDLTGKDTVTLPKIALRFDGGAVANLPVEGILLVVDISQVCLAFAGNPNDSDFGIIGNVQQRSLEVVYDIKQERIGFGPGTCGNA